MKANVVAVFLMAVLAALVSPGAAADSWAGIIHYDVRADGLACPFCAYGLEKKLKALPGVTEVRVELETGLASFDVAKDELVLPGAVQSAVRDAGFTPRGISARVSGVLEGTARDLRIRVGDGVEFALRSGRAFDRLNELAAPGRRAMISGELTRDGDRWTLSVDEASAEGEP